MVDLPAELATKRDRLLELLRSYGSCAVAFSGGLDSTLLAVVVVVDVHSRNVRNIPLISESCTVEDHTAFYFLCRVAVAFGSKVDAKFQRHIKTGKLCLSVQFCPGNVVNAESALFDNAVEFF